VLKDCPADIERVEQELKDAARTALGEPPTAALDIWVCDLDEWNTARTLPGHPLRTAHSEGVVLYERV